MNAATGPLARIPTPPRHRWRLFCAEALPLVVFALCGLGVLGLWRHSAAAPTLVAEAELLRSEVKAIHAGRVSDVRVRLLQRVAAGEVLAHLHPVDPAVLAASLAVIRAEVDFQRTSLAPELGPRRLAVHSARLKLDWLRERVALASLRVQLQQAEADFGRLTPLQRQGTVSEQSFDNARLLRDRLAAAIEAQQQLVDSLASTVDVPAPSPGDAHDALRASLRLQEEKLRLTEAQLAPIVLTAPIAGVVTALPITEGTTLATGDLAATIAAEAPARLVGFLRQPLPLEPREGMRVSVRARNASRASADATIVEVGRALEPISPTVLALFNRATVPELGLRVHIAVPDGFALRPGEQVDVTIPDL
ncbi:MAG: HlyD family efflux transporter periplasmic adaptor subunit [Verrucomicrobia bacterium]|nr:HlyD family efflux transporter periplasmic adaptor subunit [Verrucomicrobiota bacterium]